MVIHSSESQEDDEPTLSVEEMLAEQKQEERKRLREVGYEHGMRTRAAVSRTVHAPSQKGPRIRKRRKKPRKIIIIPRNGNGRR